MEHHKFKTGDIIRTIGDSKARVMSSSVKVTHNSDGTIDRVNMVEVEIIGGHRDGELASYEESSMSFDVTAFAEQNSNVTITDACPKCGSEWHVSGFTKEWKDCLKCGKRAEDLCAEKKTEDVGTKSMAELFNEVYGKSDFASPSIPFPTFKTK